MAIIKQLTDLFNTTKVYPVTLAKAVYTEDGHRLSDILDNISAGLNTYVIPEMFGARGDGVTDDTSAIQKAHDYARANNKDLVLYKGTYIISTTLDFDISVKIRCEGKVIIKSTCNNKPAIKVTSHGESITHIIHDSGTSSTGVVIDGGSGGLVITRGDLTDINENTSIGLEIGDAEYIDLAQPISRCMFKNISIFGFHTGLKINTFNTYIMEFNRIWIEYANVCAVWGSDSIQNSGENISFNNCTFSHSYNGFIQSQAVTVMNFNQCSFDFNGNHYIMNCDSNAIVNFKGCHFEGVGFIDEHISAQDIHSYIIYKNGGEYNTPIFNLDGCMIHTNTFTSGEFLFGTNTIDRKNMNVVLNNCTYSFEPSTKLEGAVLSDINVTCYGTPIRIYEQKNSRFYNLYDKIGFFSSFDDGYSGDYVVQDERDTFKKSGFALGGNTWSNQSLNFSVQSSETFDKELTVSNIATTTYCSLIRKINVYGEKQIASVCFAKVGEVDVIYDRAKCITTHSYYDSNDNLILVNDYIETQLSYKTDWMAAVATTDVPVGTSYVEVQCTIQLLSTESSVISFTGNIMFGGLCYEGRS